VKIEQLVISPCCNPEMALDDVLSAYSTLGYSNFEVFTSWAKSAYDVHSDPQVYLAKGRQYGMSFTSFHLPPVKADRRGETLQEAIEAARIADLMGVEIVLFKADQRSTYIQTAPDFLDAIDDLSIIPVIQNHNGSALTSLDDVEEVRRGIGDPRMRTLLEVGHFHSAGQGWREAADVLGDSISLVHIKDQVGEQSVPFGQGEIDLQRLFQYMDDRGYDGRYVVEMEVSDSDKTLEYLADARKYIQEYLVEGQ
jgi:sugar phosphate isomerase/epimerase